MDYDTIYRLNNNLLGFSINPNIPNLRGSLYGYRLLDKWPLTIPPSNYSAAMKAVLDYHTSSIAKFNPFKNDELIPNYAVLGESFERLVLLSMDMNDNIAQHKAHRGQPHIFTV